MATKKKEPASPKRVPLGTGLADLAKQALAGRKHTIDDQVDGVTPPKKKTK